MSRFKNYAGFTFVLATLFALLIGATFSAADIRVLEKEKKIIVDGEISTELDRYADTLGGAMEYVAVSRGGKEYESIVVLDCQPVEIYDALIKLGVEKGTPASFDENDRPIMPTGGPVRLYLEWKDESGKKMRIRPELMVYNIKAKQRMQYVNWPFTGSVMGYFDPESDDEVLQASVSKNIVSLHHGDQSVILQNPQKAAAETKIPYRLRSRILEDWIKEKTDQGAKESEIKSLKKRLAALPKAGTKVKFIIDANNPMIQVHAFISGEVQGVGFRDFTQRNAKQFGVHGFVKNLKDGKVELVAEGSKFAIDDFLKRVKRGPRTAKVEKVDIKEGKFSGKYDTFEIEF